MGYLMCYMFLICCYICMYVLIVPNNYRSINQSKHSDWINLDPLTNQITPCITP